MATGHPFVAPALAIFPFFFSGQSDFYALVCYNQSKQLVCHRRYY